jgi:hypothetical protein
MLFLDFDDPTIREEGFEFLLCGLHFGAVGIRCRVIFVPLTDLDELAGLTFEFGVIGSERSPGCANLHRIVRL